MNRKGIITIYNYLLIIIAISFSSCSSSLFFFSKKHKLINKFSHSQVLQKEFTGFVLFDIANNKNIIKINGDKYFTPASNTKILTFYTSLKVLNDSMPIVQYLIKGDSLIFWGTGNPLCLNPDFNKSINNLKFLKNNDKKLFYCTDNFQDNRFGSGWAWDDYIYSYQYEKSPFPIYGNRLSINFKEDSFIAVPNIFNINNKQDSNYYFRDEFKNDFQFGKFSKGYSLQIPFITDSLSIVKLLSIATNKQINKCPDLTLNDKYKAKTLKIKTPDTLYLRLLHNSDNFIAEQLMQMCSFTLFDTINTQRAIKYSKEFILPKLDGRCRWVDGSGLSRYNLFSPNDMIYALKMIYDTLNWEQITTFFPTAGKSGTLKNSYTNIKIPFIYAKSGSLSNNYNLSGYILTKKGNKYIFSFMNNHFLTNSKSIKQEMENIFKYIYMNY